VSEKEKKKVEAAEPHDLTVEEETQADTPLENKDEEDGDLVIPSELPLLPIRDVVIFPFMIMPLFVGRESSIKAVDEALNSDRLIFLATQKNVAEENPSPDDIYQVGTISMIMRMLKLPDGRVKILVQGLAKGKIKAYHRQDPLFMVEVEKIDEPSPVEADLEMEAMIRMVKERLERIISLGKSISPEVAVVLENINDPGRLADLIVSNLGLKVEVSQEFMETIEPRERLLHINEILAKEIQVLEMQVKIQSQAKDEMTKTQREYFLKEQMRAIRAELGDLDERTQEIDELRKEIKKCKMPKQANKESIKQLERLERMHPDSAEANIVRTYLDWMIELPWNKKTRDNLNLKQARKILDEDHYGLNKIKDRIIEYLAVCKLKNKLKGPILCFVGPPGVGKTSLGKSIARAQGRKFFRMSLGGVKDEAEIRGHRRTYIGALPGRIIQGIKQAGTKNPVFMMDEIDKVGSDFRGDPSSALLEVLDPEQNFEFSDHYLNVNFDLSNVMFITTANTLDTIPAALRDRMEIIELSGYTDEEKLHIARQYLLSSQNLHKFLGPPQYLPEENLQENQVGVATGLAWTSYGGVVLQVETTVMPGKGNLALTGQLGDVMKESAQAALSYIRSRAAEFGIDAKTFKENDIHIHVPAGATPKDGPSAGITMLTSLVSALTGIPVYRTVAMTGEVTLTGRVMPIGGLKEKVLAAVRFGASTVLFPEANQKDLVDIPKNIQKKISLVSVGNAAEVLLKTLTRQPGKSAVKKKK